MSIAFASNSSSSDSNRIQSLGFAPGMWIYNLSEAGRFTGGDHWSCTLPVVKEEEDSRSSSTIGKNSDASGAGGDSDDDDGEVQSSIKGPLNTLSALEEVLPIKRGISSFYAGKSKSYSSLADASSVPSIQDIAKPGDAYTRKRKNMIAHSVLLDKNDNSTSINGISKRFANSSRSTLSLGLNINIYDNHKSGESSNLNSSAFSLSHPPLPTNSRRLPTNESLHSSPGLYCSPWRSLSLSDLRHAVAAAEVATSSFTGSISNTVQYCQRISGMNDATRMGLVK